MKNISREFEQSISGEVTEFTVEQDINTYLKGIFGPNLSFHFAFVYKGSVVTELHDGKPHIFSVREQEIKYLKKGLTGAVFQKPFENEVADRIEMLERAEVKKLEIGDKYRVINDNRVLVHGVTDRYHP